MSVKVKMRCARCGKSFKSSGAKQTLCPDCDAKARNERASSKSAAPKPMNTSPAQPQAPKIVGPGASILVPGLVAAQPPAPAERGTLGQRHPVRGTPAATGDNPGRPGHTPHPAHGPAASLGSSRTPHGEPAAHDKPQRKVRPEEAKSQPKVRKEPKLSRPPVPAIELTDEMRQKVEQRYLELANPVEFDGIRTQIAGELSIPKALVKKAVLELRARMQMPSWWELQSYTGGNSDLERIRRAYMPLLPVPEVGIHKTIAAELGLEPGVVYQGIKRIRAEMRLPRYNAPELHGKETGAGVEQLPVAPDAHEVPASAESGETA